MTLQATCPECRATYRLADTSRGKKLRCSRCKAVFTAGAAADDGKDSAAIMSTPARAKAAAPNTTRKATPQGLFEDEEDRFLKKKHTSMLPYLLIAFSVVIFLCGGGSIGGLIAWRWFAVEQARAEAEQERAEQQRIEAERRLGQEARQRFDADFDKAQAEHERQRQEVEKRFEEHLQEARRQRREMQKRLEADIEEQRKLIEEQLKDLIPAILPPNMDDPFMPQPRRDVVQAVSRSIALRAKSHEIMSILWPASNPKQVVVASRLDLRVRVEQYDLTNGRRLGGIDMALQSPIASIRDVSADGSYYVCNSLGRTTLALWNLPHPKPIIENWQPPPLHRKGEGLADNNMVAAYWLNGPRLLTVNDAGHVAVWSVPKDAKGKPSLQGSYVPDEALARYAAPLGDTGIALSPDRTSLAVFNGKDGFLLLDTATLRLQGVVTSPEDALADTDPMHGLYGVAFSPDGKQLAAVLHSQSFRVGAKPTDPQLIRWDVKTRQRTARFADPSKGAGWPGSRLGWWGNDYVWIASATHPGSLISWTKQRVVVRASLRLDEKLSFGNTDGKCWFVTAVPGGNTFLKCVDLPAAALQQADQLLELTDEGIVRK